MAARIIFFFGLCFAACPFWHSEAATSDHKRPVTVEDCVATHRIFDDQMEISPDGLSVAYVVKAPNLSTDENDYLVYVRDLRETKQRENGRLLLKADKPLQTLAWTLNGSKPVLQYEPDTMHEVVELDPASGDSSVVVRSNDRITSFSTTADGVALVYSTVAEAPVGPAHTMYIQYGYPVTLWKGVNPPGEGYRDFRRSKLFLANRQSDGKFSVSEIRAEGFEPVREISALSLSPDARYLVFSYKSNDVPEGWSSNPIFEWLHTGGGMLGLLDLKTAKTSIAFNAPAANWWLPVTWAADSSAFVVNAVSPVGSSWEAEDRRAGFTEGEDLGSHTHVFGVDVASRGITEILEHPAQWYSDEVLYWEGTGHPLLARKDEQSFAWFKQIGNAWRETRESVLSLGPVNITPSTEIVKMTARSDGHKVVGVMENNSTPPDLFVHDLSSGQSQVITDLNAEFRSIGLEPVENFTWHDRLGYVCTGLLIRPANYRVGIRYPLIVMGKSWIDGYFLSDTQYRTAFAPEVLAADGFVVLLANERPAEFTKDRELQYPSRAPGRMSDVAEFENVVESGIDALAMQGLVDKTNVGLMGFSTTSWKTDIFLTHTNFAFRAASSADSGLWNYGLYWLSNRPPDSTEKYMGGPPYGKTFQNWLRYSPAFNAGKMRTPLLMEYIEPTTAGLEFFVALSRQGKPVDLFLYPNGAHELDTPFQRVASLQRNVDWFRFWMQDYEGKPPPYDPEQYARWNKLRLLKRQER